MLFACCQRHFFKLLLNGHWLRALFWDIYQLLRGLIPDQVKNDTQRWNHRGNCAEQITAPKRELPNQLGTLHWPLRICCGLSDTWNHQDFIAKLKAGVEQPEMLLALQLAQISAHIPVGTSGSVAVTGLLLLQRNMRIAISSNTLCLWSCFFCWHPKRWSCHMQVGKRTLQVWHWN